jgi:hypothetical protein
MGLLAFRGACLAPDHHPAAKTLILIQWLPQDHQVVKFQSPPYPAFLAVSEVDNSLP